jgi:hypothetical protein
MRTRPFLAALALALTSAACGHSPTALSAGDVKAHHDGGGWTIGSGGRADTTGTSTTTADGTTDGRCGSEETGGWTIGSGGATQPPDRCEGR